MVVVGFDQTLTYETLTIACRLIDRGVPYIATHPDVRCPIEGGNIFLTQGLFWPVSKPLREKIRNILQASLTVIWLIR